MSRAPWPNCQHLQSLLPQQTQHLTQTQGPFSCQLREKQCQAPQYVMSILGKEAPRPSASGVNTRLRQALTSASPVTVGAFKLPWPGRGKSAPSNGSSSSTAPCCSKAGCELLAVQAETVPHAAVVQTVCFFFFFFFLGYRGDVHPLPAKHRQRHRTNLICAGTTA